MKKLSLNEMAAMNGGGWFQCVLGIVGGGILGFFAGFAFGGWGGVIGAVGGASAGASSSCYE
jgi:hypothetical protein